MTVNYPDSRWAISDDQEGRWFLYEREQAVSQLVSAQWQASALLPLPADETSVREAVDFAYMMGDVEAPATIDWVAGPRAGMRRAAELGCTWCADFFVPENRRSTYDFSSALRSVAGLSWDTAFDDITRRNRWTDPGNALVDSMLADLGWPKEWADFTTLFATAALGDFLLRSNLLADAGWEGMKRLLFACGPWWWASQEAFIACRAPERASFDVNRLLHDDEGPALRYADGTEIHAWRGRRVSAELWRRRRELTVAEIAQEENVELRRVLIDMYGLGRYLSDLGARVPVAKDAWGKLWRGPPLPGEMEDLQLVEVRNATAEPDGTFKTYFLRVPPTIRSARAAVAWTFGLDADAYAPKVET